MSQSVAGREASRALRRAYWFYRAYRVEKALLELRDAVERKYNPNQPRVPAGDPRGGQWTDGVQGTNGDRSSDARRIRVAQNDDANTLTDVPPRPRNLPGSIRSLSDIPKEKPNSKRTENALVKFLAHRLTDLIALRSLQSRFPEDVAHKVRRALLAAEVATWVTEDSLLSIISYHDAPKSLEELQADAAAGPRSGYEIHHIVERNSIQLGEEARINSPENLVRVPKFKHHLITRWFSKGRKDFGGMSPREYLRDKSWEERMEVGLEVLIEEGVLRP